MDGHMKRSQGIRQTSTGRSKSVSVESAIRELELEVKRVQKAIATLKRMRAMPSAPAGLAKQRRRHRTLKARQEIMQARRSRLARTEDSALNTLAKVFSRL